MNEAISPTPPRDHPAPPQLLGAREVAGIFGKTLRTLTNWERRGWLIPSRVGGLRYYHEADVRELWFKVQNIIPDQLDGGPA